MDWQPDNDALQQLTTLLAATLDARDKNRQKTAELTLKQSLQNPDIHNYLTYLTVQRTSDDAAPNPDITAGRSAAGLMLKNEVRASWKSMREASKAYVRRHILAGLSDDNASIRSYTGMVVTEVVRQGGLYSWTDLLPQLINLIENADGRGSLQAQDGAMRALQKICEDNKKALNKEYNSERPVDVLVPKLIEFSNNNNPKVRWQALATLWFFLLDEPPDVLQVNVEYLLQNLFQRAHDENEDVRRYVCRLFTSLAGRFPQLIIPNFEGIVDYVLAQQQNGSNADLALDAAEFFFENAESIELQQAFSIQLNKIIPVLLATMRYDEEHQERLEAEVEEDAGQKDRDQDVKPQFASSKSEKGTGTAGGSAPAGYAYADDDSDGEIDDSDDDVEPDEEWGLRKASAASLDFFAARFPQMVFDATLPYLKENLSHTEWVNREAAVLTLGAIQTGCMQFVEPSLPELVPYLLSLLHDPFPVVRQISAWTIGKYSGWASRLEESGKKQSFEPIMEGLLKTMLDGHKKVQKAAISAFASLEEQAKENLIPYGPIIAEHFAKCFNSYSTANLYLLYDCVQTLSESLGAEMASPRMVDTLMPSVISRWEFIVDDSQEIFPLLECLSYLATSMGAAFAPFADPLFHRCCRIIRDKLDERRTTASQQAFRQPDPDYLVVSLDLLSAILQAVDEAQATKLIKENDMFVSLAWCMQESNNDVRQSAYALLGDSAVNVFDALRPYLEPIMKLILQQLDLTLAEQAPLQQDRDTVYRVINNVCWSAGEIVMRAGSDLNPIIDELLQKLGNILFEEKIPSSLQENAATTIGRLGCNHAETLAPHLASFAPRFLAIMQRVPWLEEKAHAMQGFTNVVAANPQGLEQCLVPYLGEVGTGLIGGMPPPSGFEQVFRKYQSMIGDFSAFLQTLPEPQRHALQQTFGIA